MSRSSVPGAARGGGRRARCFHLTWVTCAATRAATTLCEDVAPDQAQRHDDGEERHRFRYCFHRYFLIPGSITLIHDAVRTSMLQRHVGWVAVPLALAAASSDGIGSRGSSSSDEAQASVPPSAADFG